MIMCTRTFFLSACAPAARSCLVVCAEKLLDLGLPEGSVADLNKSFAVTKQRAEVRRRCSLVEVLAQAKRPDQIEKREETDTYGHMRSLGTAIVIKIYHFDIRSRAAARRGNDIIGDSSIRR